jgi:uncharacterized protein (TIGR03118 family)
MAIKIALFAVSLAVTAPAYAASVAITNLTSDGAGNAAFTDANLKNPWGISYSPTGAFWVSDNATGLTTLYNGTGMPQSLVVTIPAAGGGTTGTPTGQVFNATTGFTVSQGSKKGAAVFIFDSEDGSISGWAPSVNPTTAVTAVDRSGQGAVYKGLALYTTAKGATLLLATDFHGGTVDVFDNTFKLVQQFRDKKFARNYSPYNVQVLNGQVFVTYAKVDKARHDNKSCPGCGGVEVLTGVDGSHTPKVAHRYMHGELNGPWGLAVAPSSWGSLAGDILVGNFSNGWIEAFTPTLSPVGLLNDANGAPIFIDGLWGLIPGNGASGGATNTIYFSAGTNDEADGLFGALTFTP